MNSSAGATKDATLNGLRDARKSILNAVAALSEEERESVFLGSWPVMDLLAHLVGWDLANLEGIKAVLAGRVPEFYAHHDRDWQTFNAALVANYRANSTAELVALARDSQRQLIDFAATVPPESFNKDFGVRFRGYKVTVRRLLEAETKDEQAHYRQMIDFFGREK